MRIKAIFREISPSIYGVGLEGSKPSSKAQHLIFTRTPVAHRILG